MFYYPSRLSKIRVAAWLLAVIVTSIAHAQPRYRTIALTGMQAPDLEAGIIYDDFSVPSISSTGHVGYVARLSGVGVNDDNNYGVFSGDVGGGQLVVRERDTIAVPSGEAEVLLDFSRNVWSSSGGSVTFDGSLTGPGLFIGGDAVFSNVSGSLEVVTYSGFQAPGLAPGVNLSESLDIAVNGAGKVAFRANLSGDGVDETNNWAYFSNAGGQLTVVASKGDPAPGAEAGVNFDNLSSDFVFNNAGQIAFTDGLTTIDTEGFFLADGNGGQLVAISGMPAPSAPAGANFANFSNSSIAINHAGQTAFYADVSLSPGFTEGIFSTRTGELQAVALLGDNVPGINIPAQFADIRARTVINGAGDTAFVGNMEGLAVGPLTDSALFAQNQGELEMVARRGFPAPDIPEDVRFHSFEPETVFFNAAGQVAFSADLTLGGGVDTPSSRGLFTEIDNELRLIARTGDLFDVDDDPLVESLREIASFKLPDITGGEDGRLSPFNDAGQLAFMLQFTDGTTGIFVAETGLPGDFNGSGNVDGADFLFWQRNHGDTERLQIWEENYGAPDVGLAGFSAALAVPEPNTAFLSLFMVALAALCRQRGYQC